MIHEGPVIEGAKVTLRPFSFEDISDSYVGWFNDPEVTKYNSHGDTTYTRARAEEYVKEVTSSEEYFVCAVIAKDSGTHIGNISLQRIDKKNQSAEYAIIIGEKHYWGTGAAKEASRLLLTYGFNTLRLNRIYCGTSVENIPMQRLAAALGFKEEGRRRGALYKGGRFVDTIEYGMLQSDLVSSL